MTVVFRFTLRPCVYPGCDSFHPHIRLYYCACTHTHALTHSLSLTHTYTHSLSLSHTRTHTLSLSLSLSLSPCSSHVPGQPAQESKEEERTGESRPPDFQEARSSAAWERLASWLCSILLLLVSYIQLLHI